MNRQNLLASLNAENMLSRRACLYGPTSETFQCHHQHIQLQLVLGFSPQALPLK